MSVDRPSPSPPAVASRHELWNLTHLCSGHHAALHDGLLEMHRQAPHEIAFRWVYGPPLPAGLDPEARHALIAERIAQIFAGMLPMTGSSPPADHGTARPGWDGSPVGST